MQSEHIWVPVSWSQHLDCHYPSRLFAQERFTEHCCVCLLYRAADHLPDYLHLCLFCRVLVNRQIFTDLHLSISLLPCLILPIFNLIVTKFTCKLFVILIQLSNYIFFFYFIFGLFKVLFFLF
jgi:hypothetical protein